MGLGHFMKVNENQKWTTSLENIHIGIAFLLLLCNFFTLRNYQLKGFVFIIEYEKNISYN